MRSGILFAAAVLEQGCSPKWSRALWGHQHYSTIIDIYTHVSESKYQEEVGENNGTGRNGE